MKITYNVCVVGGSHKLPVPSCVYYAGASSQTCVHERKENLFSSAWLTNADLKMTQEMWNFVSVAHLAMEPLPLSFV